MHYRVYSTMTQKSERWYATRAEAIAAFERKCNRVGLAPPLSYPPASSGDTITRNDVAYPRSSCAAGMREGHRTVYVDARNDVLQ